MLKLSVSIVVYTIEPNSGPTQLSVVTDTTVTSTSTRTFRIRILQLECTHPYLGEKDLRTFIITNLPHIWLMMKHFSSEWMSSILYWSFRNHKVCENESQRGNHIHPFSIFRSFNYKTTVTGQLPNHLANLNYAICFRIENGYCGMKFSQPISDIYSFTLSGDATMCKSIQLI